MNCALIPKTSFPLGMAEADNVFIAPAEPVSKLGLAWSAETK